MERICRNQEIVEVSTQQVSKCHRWSKSWHAKSFQEVEEWSWSACIGALAIASRHPGAARYSNHQGSWWLWWLYRWKLCHSKPFDDAKRWVPQLLHQRINLSHGSPKRPCQVRRNASPEPMAVGQKTDDPCRLRTTDQRCCLPAREPGVTIDIYYSWEYQVHFWK